MISPKLEAPFCSQVQLRRDRAGGYSRLAIGSEIAREITILQLFDVQSVSERSSFYISSVTYHPDYECRASA